MRRVYQLLETIDSAPDAAPRYFRDRFARIPGEAADLLLEQFPTMGTVSRSLTIDWCRDNDVEEALLPMMRFVFDTRQSKRQSRNPSLAMQAVIDLGRGSDRARLHAFALDVVDHADRYVRGHCLTLLGRLGGPRSRAAIEAGLHDSSRFVREQAEEILEKRPGLERRKDPSWSPLSKRELLDEYRRIESDELGKLFEHLRRREDGLEVLRFILLEGERRPERALRVLGDFEQPEVRDVIRQYLRTRPSGKAFRLALRGLMPFLTPDSLHPLEAKAIDGGLRSPSPALRCTACRAARLVENENFGPAIADLLTSDDEEVLRVASRTLDCIVEKGDEELFEKVVAGQRNVTSVRVENESKALEEVEVTILRLLKRLYRDTAAESSGRSPLTEQCFRSMRAGSTNPELFTSGLALLNEMTPAEGYDDRNCWNDRHASFVTGMLGRVQPDTREQFVELIRRGASSDFEPRFCRVASVAIGGEPVDSIDELAELLNPKPGQPLYRTMSELFAMSDASVREALNQPVEQLKQSVSGFENYLGNPQKCPWSRQVQQILSEAPNDEIRRENLEFMRIVAPISTTSLGVLFMTACVVGSARSRTPSAESGAGTEAGVMAVVASGLEEVATRGFREFVSIKAKSYVREAVGAEIGDVEVDAESGQALVESLGEFLDSVDEGVGIVFDIFL